MGAQHFGHALSSRDVVDPLDYCRQIEAYLCRKNDGHLIRVVGPSFEVVSAWARDGIPFKMACEGIDRYYERYYRQGPRRRPVRIEFCDADVRDVFHAWRKATGVIAAATGAAAETAPPERRGPSLPEHLERALLRLTDARATGKVTSALDTLIDAVSAALDDARAAAGGLRGEKRQALLERLRVLDEELGVLSAQQVDAPTYEAIEQEAGSELESYRSTLSPEQFDRARQVAVDRLVRLRLGLPTLRFH